MVLVKLERRSIRSQKSSFYDVADLLETLTKIGGHTRDVPPKSECYFFIVSASQFQCDSCSDTIRVWDNTKYVDA